MLTSVDKETYDRVVRAVPEHDNKVHEHRMQATLYYERQYIFDEQGRLVAFHDDDGQRWADVSLLGQSGKVIPAQLVTPPA